MPFKWDDAADKEMLMAIMKLSGGLPKSRSQDIADLMDNKVTGYAIEHRLRSLKKEFNMDGKEGGPKTPAKTPAKKGSASTGKRKAKQDAGSDNDDEEQIEKGVEETPSKKQKTKNADEIAVETKMEVHEDEDDSEWLI